MHNFPLCMPVILTLHQKSASFRDRIAARIVSACLSVHSSIIPTDQSSAELLQPCQVVCTITPLFEHIKPKDPKPDQDTKLEMSLSCTVHAIGKSWELHAWCSMAMPCGMLDKQQEWLKGSRALCECAPIPIYNRRPEPSDSLILGRFQAVLAPCTPAPAPPQPPSQTAFGLLIQP